MSIPLAMSRLSQAWVVFGVVSVIGLLGMWLLVSSAARRSELVQRGGADLRRRRRLDEMLDARLARTRRGADLAAKLKSAGVELTAARFLLVVGAAAVGAFLMARLLFPVALACVAGALAAWACFAWLDHRLDKRREQFVGQLPEVARLLSNGAAAGLSMPAAIELAVREMEAPAREELQTVIDELTYGRSLEDSLASLQRRLPSREIAVLMTTLVIQQRAGGDVVRALQDLSDTLNSRRETLREVKTLMAGSVYTSYLVPLLGIGALVMLNTVNSNTLQRMTSKPVGIAALVVAGVLYTIGWLATRRTTRIEL
jgi:tight adherence protein B